MKTVLNRIYLSVGLTVGAGILATSPSVAGNVTRVSNVQLTETMAPTRASEAVKVLDKSQLVLTDDKGTTSVTPLKFNVLFHPGEVIGSSVAALIRNVNSKPIKKSLPANYGIKADGPFYSNSPTANMFLHSGKSSKTFLLTLYDSQQEGESKATQILNLYGKLPGTAELAEIEKPADGGRLKAAETTNVEAKDLRGLWFPTGAVKTGWNTALVSEAKEPDAQYFQTRPLELANLYMKTTGKVAKKDGGNPYDYGYRLEISLDKDNTPVAQAHYALGRLSGSAVALMPDNRTVFITDDAYNGGFFMFVADKASDLSAGTLYAAKWRHVQDDYSGAGFFGWMRLEHASDSEIKKLLDGGIQFGDIFDVINEKKYLSAPDKYKDYKLAVIYPFFEDKSGNTREYLRLKPGMEKAAAFLESRRYAQYIGATTEFSFIRDMTYNAAENKLYLAVNEVAPPMRPSAKDDNNNNSAEQDDVRFAGTDEDLRCGMILESRMGEKLKDSADTPIDSKYVALATLPILLGQSKNKMMIEYQSYDKCDTNRVANPGSLAYDGSLHLLFIGEDSKNHMNNFLWAYDRKTRQLTRILSAPATAAITGLKLHTIGDSEYLFMNYQQPATYANIKEYTGELKAVLRKNTDKRASIGYLGPIPKVEFITKTN
jgi:secreted PhoX family phosphatase